MKRIIGLGLFIIICLAICISLGETDADVWVCPNCGNRNESNFCPECGTKRPDQQVVATEEQDKGIPTRTGDLSNDFALADLSETMCSWIGEQYDDVNPVLLSAGFEYKGTDSAWSGNVYVYRTSIYDFDITLFDEDTDGIIEKVEALFGANAKAYRELYNSITARYGEAVVYSQRTYMCETARWMSPKSVEYRISGDMWTKATEKNMKGHCSLSSVKSGKHSFQLLLFFNEEPLYTEKPKSTPTPVPIVNCEISIVSARLNSNSITPLLFVVFKNESKTTVDRIDFAVKCYDAYGSRIKSYGYYDYIECFYDQNVKSNHKTRNDWRWYMDGLDGIKSVEIAITKYHQTDGTIVSIPEDQQEWKEFTFK